MNAPRRFGCAVITYLSDLALRAIGCRRDPRLMDCEPAPATEGVGEGEDGLTEAERRAIRLIGGRAAGELARACRASHEHAADAARSDREVSWALIERVSQKLKTRIGRDVATVMVVDDEAAVLSVMVRLVVRAGHTVLPCTSLNDVKCFLAAGLRPDVLVTDIVLGQETGVTISKLLGDVPTIYVSGYPNVRPPHRGDVLAKPFDHGEFIDAIERNRKARVASVSHIGKRK